MRLIENDASWHTDLKLLPLLPLVFFCFHIGYGYGFLLGVLHFGVLRRAAVPSMTAIVRRAKNRAETIIYYILRLR